MITSKIDAMNPDLRQIRIAADAIRRGELVIFPTETVYGLAVDALNEDAVRRVFEAKGRYDKQALPVQVGSLDQVTRVASFVPDDARRLAERCWPGPLTLILQRNPSISKLVTGGRETVGIRIPDHPVAQALLAELGSPIVATSANLSGRAAPKNAQEAVSGVGRHISVVLDAGESRLGTASTVVDVSTVPPRILRRGAISVDEIRDVLGEVEEID